MRIVLAVLVSFLTACTQIDTGNVGVERTLGKVSDQALPPGVYFTLFKRVDEFTVKEIAFGLNDMRPKSRDNLTINDLDVDVYFKVDPAKVVPLVVKYQGDAVRYGELVKGGSDDLVVGYNRVLREAREAVYGAVAEFDATTMHTRRADIAAALQRRLQAELNANDPGAFLVTAVNVRNLVTDPAIEAAIRQRAEVDQQVARKQKELELAQAESERRKVEAEGEARANRILADSLDARLIELKRIEAMAAFAKAGTHTVVMPSSATPLVQVK